MKTTSLLALLVYLLAAVPASAQATFDDDQAAAVIYDNADGGAVYTNVGVRCSGTSMANFNGYLLGIGTSSAYVLKWIDGLEYGPILTVGGVTENDKVALAALGTSIEIYVNDMLIDAVTDTLGTPHASGRPCVMIYANTDARLDDFIGDPLTLGGSFSDNFDTGTSPNTDNWTIISGSFSLTGGELKGAGTGYNLMLATPTDSGGPLMVTTTTLPSGMVSSAYSQVISANGGTTPYSWAESGSGLGLGACAGLSLTDNMDDTATVSGTPTTAGTCNFTVEVTDDVMDTDTQALSIVVAAEGGGGSTIHADTLAELKTAASTIDCGGVITLNGGQNYDESGTWQLPARNCGSNFITIKTLGTPTIPTTRNQCTASGLAQIRGTSTSGEPPIWIKGGSNSGWRFSNLAFTKTTTVNMFGLLRFGDQNTGVQVSLATTPQYIQLLGSYVYVSSPSASEQRGFIADARNVTIRHNCVEGFISPLMDPIADTQCFYGSNGSRDVVIEHNYFSCGSEDIIFGGGLAVSAEMVPRNITVKWNTFEKDASLCATHAEKMKHHFELKSAVNVLVAYNRFGRTCASTEGGISVVYTTQDQDGNCAWCVVDEVTHEYNIHDDVGSGFRITGHDADHDTTPQGGTIIIRHNFVRTNASYGSGHFAQISHDPRLLTITRNTAIHHGSIMVATAEKTETNVEATFNDNFFQFLSAAFGLNASPDFGQDALDAVFTSATWGTNVVLEESGNCTTYSMPMGSVCLSGATFEAIFADYDGDPEDGDFVVVNPTYEDIGVDWDTLLAGIGGGGGDVISPTVTITSPTSSSTHGAGSTATVALGGTASDNVGVASCSGSSVQTGSFAVSGTTTWTASIVALNVGSNVITVTCVDAASNAGSDMITITRDPDPAPVSSSRGRVGAPPVRHPGVVIP